MQAKGQLVRQPFLPTYQYKREGRVGGGAAAGGRGEKVTAKGERVYRRRWRKEESLGLGEGKGECRSDGCNVRKGREGV